MNLSLTRLEKSEKRKQETSVYLTNLIFGLQCAQLLEFRVFVTLRGVVPLEMLTVLENFIAHLTFKLCFLHVHVVHVVFQRACVGVKLFTDLALKPSLQRCRVLYFIVMLKVTFLGKLSRAQVANEFLQLIMHQLNVLLHIVTLHKFLSTLRTFKISWLGRVDLSVAFQVMC